MNAFVEYEKGGAGEEPSSSMGIYLQQTQNNLEFRIWKMMPTKFSQHIGWQCDLHGVFFFPFVFVKGWGLIEKDSC